MNKSINFYYKNEILKHKSKISRKKKERPSIAASEQILK